MTVSSYFNSCLNHWPKSTWARVFLVRIAVTLWAIFMGLVGRPYDTSITLAPSPPDAPEIAPLDAYIIFILAPLANWDAVYFAAIARDGYASEEFFAFFPFFAFILRVTGEAVFLLLDGAASRRPALLIGGVLFNIAAGVVAALALERLSRAVGRSPRSAARDAVVFAAGPLGIFGSALYSENLFAALTFSGLAELEYAAAAARKNAKSLNIFSKKILLNFFAGCALLVCAAACRANGMLGGVFVLVAGTRVAFSTTTMTKMSVIVMRTAFLLVSFVGAACVAVPFAGLAWHAFSLHCSGASSSPSLPQWCNAAATAWYIPIPPVYAHVQRTYWDAGVPFGRWTLKHSPALILALPVVCVAAWGLIGVVLRLARTTSSNQENKENSVENSVKILSYFARAIAVINSDLPYALHLAALVTVGLVAAHAQVTTRLAAAASPALSWYISDAWVTEGKGGKGIRLALALWCGGYTLIGGALFCNAFNWT